MALLNEAEKNELMQLISKGEALPEQWRPRLFPSNPRPQELGKEYRLVYEGKLKREAVLAQTPAAPWQLVRQFCTAQSHQDGWRNLLVWGDNLLALKELLADQQGQNRLGTRGKIKLIYIDPPFATRQDFMKDKEKAYRDKVLGAQFIEFLRRRLLLLREILAEDGSIYVHLDTKKSHYLKAVLDEVFGEENFLNEIIWKRSAAHSDSSSFANIHDSILFYSKSELPIFHPQYAAYDEAYALQRYKHSDPDGRRFMDDNLTAMGLRGGGYDYKWKGVRRIWRCPPETMERYEKENLLYYTRNGVARLKRYLDKMPGLVQQDVWLDIFPVNSQASERENYPTQKPESLLQRVIQTSSNEGDIILDCFSGSGTTAAVAEKLGRRWIAMDCGKLAIYTTQKRLFALTTAIGTPRKDERLDPDRVSDWTEHLKNVPGIVLITEKARKGECNVTLELLHDLALLIKKHQLIKEDAALSLICPQDKLLVAEQHLDEPEEAPGSKRIKVDGIEFRLSIIQPKQTTPSGVQMCAGEFALYRAGIYDMSAIKALAWEDYRPFVLKLFDVREHPHARYGFNFDGYIGTHSTFLWNYPDYKTLTLDYGYVDDLHRTIRGKPGDRFYIIAPVLAMAFAEDEVVRSEATYVFLKVPLSVLLRLIESKEPAALKQPSKEADVNEVIDAVGFDFISQPQVVWAAKKERRNGELFDDYVLEISEFRAQTLATDPDDFQNFETFSMAMVDLNYDRDVFRLTKVFWGEDILDSAGGLESAERLELRIPEQEFTGKEMMVILCDRYGNEKSLLLRKSDFQHPAPAKSNIRRKSKTK